MKYDKQKFELGMRLASIGCRFAVAMTAPDLRGILGELGRLSANAGTLLRVDIARDRRMARKALISLHAGGANGR